MKPKSITRLLVVLILVLVSLPPQRTAFADTIYVRIYADGGWDSLRWAIEEANSREGHDIIEFDIPGCSQTCLIQPETHLPPLTDPAGVTIDGTTQFINKGTINHNGPEIEIDGSLNELDSVYDNGFNITSSNNVIKGLIISNSALNGIGIAKVVDTDVVMNNVVKGNCIGTTSDCYHDAGNGLSGIYVGNGAANNTIGGDTEGDLNIIKWSGWNGIELHGSATQNNLVIHNKIVSIGMHGIRIYGGAKFNVIGGDSEIEKNGIYECGQDGVRIQGVGTDNNTVIGNHIGITELLIYGNGIHITDGAKNNIIGGSAFRNSISASGNGIYITGSDTISNTVTGNDSYGNTNGVVIEDGAHNNTIGPDNYIYRNHFDGVVIQGAGTENNLVIGNSIGLNLDGETDYAYQDSGVLITNGASNNTIGGSTADNRNIIAGNLGSGVVISGTHTYSNTVMGNIIGTDLEDSTGIGNQGYGVYLFDGAQFNLIGGDQASERNVISGNGDDGVAIIGREAMTNTVSGNTIGTTADGESALPNEEHGVYVLAPQNIIGGYGTGEGNLISGNNLSGVMLYAFGTGVNNLVIGNMIGTDKDGQSAVANGFCGINIAFGASDNLIGGGESGARNLISGNTDGGVCILGYETNRNVIAGNYIGTDNSGMIELPNGAHGVDINRAQNNIIGGDTVGQSNLISGNIGAGVRIVGDTALDNIVVGNYIGTDVNGQSAVPNTDFGVLIEQGAQGNQVGGDSVAERNLISGNGFSGIVITGTETFSNVVTGNFIGVDYRGEAALGNDEYGVLIGGGAHYNTVGGEMGSTGNLISGNEVDGIHITGSGTFSNTISGNTIGPDVTGELPIGNQEYGVSINGGAQDNTLGGGNLVAFNFYDGLLVSGVDTVGNVITQNSIHSNQMGIHLEAGGNGLIESPVIVNVTLDGLVSGTACAGCVVEVFWNPTPDGEGEVYLGETTADSDGNFSLSTTLPTAHNLTATATDGRGTSEFSSVYDPALLVYLPITLFED